MESAASTLNRNIVLSYYIYQVRKFKRTSEYTLCKQRLIKLNDFGFQEQ